LLGLFRSKPLLDEASVNWLFSAFDWALRNLDREIFERRIHLVTPTNRDFPDLIEDRTRTAEILFARIKHHAAMDDWPCELVEQDPDIDLHVAPTVVLQNMPRDPAGTFLHRGGDGKAARITYNPALLRRPDDLTATLAHELAHYLGATIQEPPPGGEEYHEHATDILAIVLGFGIFQTASTFSFRQYTDMGRGTQGWETRRLGYLSSKESAYALAIFCSLKNLPSSEAARFLRNPQKAFLRKAAKEIAHRPQDLARLKNDAATSHSPALLAAPI
jgi:hypothetical protein